MYARQVSMELNSNSRNEFTKKFESEILPLLNKQKGFKDELNLVSSDGKYATAVSLWESKENADAYSQAPYAEVTKILSKLVHGAPQVKTFEVANSTFYKTAV